MLRPYRWTPLSLSKGEALVRVIHSPQQLQKMCLNLRQKGKTIGFVPTMGYLHEGHQTLLRQARKKSDVVVLSVFVNPLQFGAHEDLNRYPRDEEGDLKKARKEGVNIVFLPTVESIYPTGFQTTVLVGGVSQGMCGASRPSHFAGVATVVLKLFQIVNPHQAFFGLKDYQQYAVIRRMVCDLNVPVKIVGVPTVREKDGLAMSSRNVYLSLQERSQALALSQALFEAKRQVSLGVSDCPSLLEGIQKRISREPSARIDYIAGVDAQTLEPLQNVKKGKTLFALAVFIGKTRLIDNILT